MSNNKVKHNECGHYGKHIGHGLCQRCYTRQWRIKNAASHALSKAKFRLRVHGLTIEEFDQMLATQRGRCAICIREFPSSKSTHVDHCHETGRVRGLLCFSCNKALGMLGDTALAVQRALAYVNGAPMFMRKPDAAMLARAGLKEWKPIPMFDWRQHREVA